jgi:hypothetical protein
MAFLDEHFKELTENDLEFFQKDAGTFLSAYMYWTDNLFERIMRLFVWKGNGDILPKEIESRILIKGHCGIINFFDGLTEELTAMFGSFYGVGKYFDEKPFYNMRCPIWAGSGRIGYDTAIIENTSLKNACLPMVQRYAYMLAHTEVSLVKALINLRDSGGVPVATSSKQKEDIEDYQQKLYNGEDGVVIDFGALGVEFAGTDRHTNQSIIDIMEVRQKLLKNFYSDIGIRASFDKRSNTVVNEVEADTTMLLFNITDMLEARKRSAERVNKLFGVNWSVDVSPEINYQEKTLTIGEEANNEKTI